MLRSGLAPKLLGSRFLGSKLRTDQCQRAQKPTSDWRRSASPARAHEREPVRFGLNALEAFYCEEDATPKVGSAEEQLDDCVRLGCDVVRQHGKADLPWARFAGDPLIEIPASLPDLRLRVRGDGDSNVSRMQEMLELALERGVKVVLTFLTLGAGAADILDDTWVLHSLDLRSDYKRQWMGYIAFYCAELLAHVAAAMSSTRPTFELSQVVAGIEIFNEVDGVNFIPYGSSVSASESATWWAQAYYEIASYLAAGFAWNLTPAPPFLLPGLAGYRRPDAEGSGTPRTWPFKTEWLSWFLAFLDYRWSGSHAPQLAASIDYHWYHMRDPSTGDPVGPLHVAWLVQELSEIREILDTWGFATTDVTVFESGVSVDLDGGRFPSGVSSRTALSALEDGDFLVVLEFRQPSASWPWLYLVLVDPNSPVEGFTCQPTADGGDWIDIIPTGFRFRRHQPHGAPASECDGLPTDQFIYADAEPFSLGGTLEALRYESPVLVRSPVRLDWKVWAWAAIDFSLTGRRSAAGEDAISSAARSRASEAQGAHPPWTRLLAGVGPL